MITIRKGRLKLLLHIRHVFYCFRVSSKQVFGLRVFFFSCLMHGWLSYVLSSHSLLLSLFLIIQSIWSPRGKNIEFSLPQMDCCDFLFFFWLFLKYLSSPRAIWALLIWTLKEQQVSWPALLTGKQRAWPKIHPLLSWIPLNPRTDVGRTRPSKSNLLSVGSGDGFLLIVLALQTHNVGQELITATQMTPSHVGCKVPYIGSLFL